MFIYLVFKNGECVYVGQTRRSLAQRRGKHFCDARKGRGNVLGAAIRKHGQDVFAFVRYLDCSSREELDREEIRLIAELKPRYNIQAGGTSGFEPWNKGKKEIRTEVLEKIKQSATTRKRTKRGNYSEAHKDKIRATQLKRMAKPFMCNETGQIFYNILTCAEILNLNPRSLAVLLCGKTRLKRLKGYTFSKIAQNKPSLIDLEAQKAG